MKLRYIPYLDINMNINMNIYIYICMYIYTVYICIYIQEYIYNMWYVTSPKNRGVSWRGRVATWLMVYLRSGCGAKKVTVCEWNPHSCIYVVVVLIPSSLSIYFFFKSKVPLAKFLFAHFFLTCINTTVFIIQLAKFQHLVAEIIIVTLLFC